MKFIQIWDVVKNEEDESKWKSWVMKPLLLGIAFGAGCYVSKVILTSPLMSNIVSKTV